jgi:hypothetical protein
VSLLQREELDKLQDKEAAYVLSLAQGFMEKEELEVWLASVRTVKAAVIKTTDHGTCNGFGEGGAGEVYWSEREVYGWR